MKKHHVSPASLCIASILFGGCADGDSVGPFDPTGSAADLYGEWDVNSFVPDAAECAAAGIDRVRLVFFPTTDGTGASSYTDASLTFPCADGFFDTGTTPVLRVGTFGYRWQAIASDDSVLLQSSVFVVTTSAGQESVLQPVNFVRAAPMEIAVTLRFAGDADYGSCAAAFVSSMDWELRAGASSGAVVATSNGSSACTESISILETSSTPIDSGAHVFVVHGLATDGASWSAECSWSLPIGGPIGVQCDVPRSP